MAAQDGAGIEPGRPYALATALTVLAGFVDASGYIHFHHLFVSFMSGNTTQAMVAAATGDGGTLAAVGRTLLLFVAGVTGGEVIAAASPRWGRSLVLLAEVALLAAAFAVHARSGSDAIVASAMALAMGIQNAAVHKAEGISVALTYVTGTLVHVGRGIAAALRGAGSWTAILPFLGLWIGLATGGLLGATTADRSLALALGIAAGASAALLLWTLGAALGSEGRRAAGRSAD